MAAIVDGPGSVRSVNPFDRRTFLIASGALALAACGSDGTKPFVLARRFNTEILVPGKQRLPFSIGDSQRLLSDGPATLSGRIENDNGEVVVAAISAKRRRVSDGLIYWDFHTELATVGIYTLMVDGSTGDGGAFQINDPANVTVPAPGAALPPLLTPTTADARGVDPICTRLAGPCPFHELTLTDALASGRPVAYVIGTPAHCEIGSCAPGLEFLIAAAERLGDSLSVVHAEVYVDDKAVQPTNAVNALGLTFEPVLFLADSEGKVRARLDALWDQSELDEALGALMA